MVMVVSNRFAGVGRDIRHSRGYGVPEREERRLCGVEMLVDLWVHACSYGDRADSVVTALQRAVRYCGTADGQLESSSFRSRTGLKPLRLWIFGFPL